MSKNFYDSAPKSPEGDLLSSPFRGRGANQKYYNNEVVPGG
jgi:hypothetical protein